MSVVVAVSNCDRVCMGSDSQMTEPNGSRMRMRGPKMARVGAVLCSCPSIIVADLLDLIPKPTEREIAEAGGLRRWVCGTLRPQLRRHLQDYERLELTTAGTREFHGMMIIAHLEEMVVMEPGWGVVEVDGNWCAVGSGAPEARGALSILQDTEVDTEEQVRRAVRTACELDQSCCEPVHLLWTDGPDPELTDEQCR